MLGTLAVLGGCERSVESEAAPDESLPVIGERFEAKAAGTVTGHVHWAGVPHLCPPVSAAIVGADGKTSYQKFANPNAERVDFDRGGVTGAVIFLEGIEPEQSWPWDHPVVRVEIDAEQIRVREGKALERVGFVRVGDEVEFESRDSTLQVLSARGAAFFALPFPDPGKPLRRRFTQPGLVELSSAAGRYWQRAYLWVGTNSYFAMSDANGRFSLPNVPPGDHALVAWLPSSDVAAVDRDPNTGMILRWHYAEPLRLERSVHVATGGKSEVDFWFSK
jgi:hypothetical protein